MDIGKLLQIVNSIPADKLKSDEGIKSIMRDVAKRYGKNLTDQELDKYLAQFRKVSKTETPGSLMDKLSRKGVSENDLSKLKKRFGK